MFSISSRAHPDSAPTSVIDAEPSSFICLRVRISRTRHQSKRHQSKRHQTVQVSSGHQPPDQASCGRSASPVCSRSPLVNARKTELGIGRTVFSTLLRDSSLDLHHGAKAWCKRRVSGVSQEPATEKQKTAFYGGFFNGGGTRIRTLEGYANRFTGG